MKLLIIEPWFCAIGHPAQSLINFAAAIGKNDHIHYLVSHDIGTSEKFSQLIKRLSTWGEVKTFVTTSQLDPTNTVRALIALSRMRLTSCQYQRIFFFDESLLILALLWPLFFLFIPVERISVLHLFSPNFGLGIRSRFFRFIVGKFLKRREVRFYLRTEELTAAWREEYSTISHRQICYLPSMEIPDNTAPQHPRRHSDKLAFGIIGQIRVGKGIDWLVPAFQNNTALGKLVVAGEFNAPQTREQFSFLLRFEGFINCFMSESDMLESAAEQDYLLMLYDVWDRRMESAVLYLAARVNRPVIVYGDSWCGRMVKKFGCGVIAPVEREETLDLFRRLPHPETPEYVNLLKGMETFRQAYSVNSLRSKVIQELLG